MNLDTQTLFLKKSLIGDSLGGGIADDSLEQRGVFETKFLLNSEEAFFSSENIKVFYIHNVSNRTLKNVEVSINGDSLYKRSSVHVDVDTYPSDIANSIDDAYSWLDYYYKHQLGETLTQKELYRFEHQNADLNDIPNDKTLAQYSGSTPEERYLSWFKFNHFTVGFTNSSSLKQVDFSLAASRLRRAPTVSLDGTSPNFSTSSLAFQPSYERLKLPVQLEPGEYWPIYVKVSPNFSPMGDLPVDLGMLSMSWQEQSGEVRNSYTTRVVVYSNSSEVSKNFTDVIKRMYAKYPPFFKSLIDSEKESPLYKLTQALASMLSNVLIATRRLLPSLYLRGTTNPADYSSLAFTGDLPNKIPQAYGNDLDLIGQTFDVTRFAGEQDEPFRQRIIFTIQKSTTIAGIEGTVKFILEKSPFFAGLETDVKYTVAVKENQSYFFDAVSTPFGTPLRSKENLLWGLTIYIKPKPQFDNNGILVRALFSGNYRRVVQVSESDSFREILSILTASGIRIDKVIFEQPGSGGNRGESNVY